MNLLLTLPGGSEWLLLSIPLLVMLLPFILFLLNLQNTLNAISPENRKISPSNVWLMFVPLFNIVWQFIMVDKIAESIGAECNRLNLNVPDNKPTYSNGLAWNICNCIAFIPFIGPIAALVTFILYWVKVAEMKRIILANQHNMMLDAERNIFHGDPVK